jgi:hypothetical protein
VRFFVFVDTPYYPYVAEPIEARSAVEAERLAIERERPGIGDVVYVAADVRGGPMRGPVPQPHPLIELFRRHNRLSASVIEAKNLAGGFTVKVE